MSHLHVTRLQASRRGPRGHEDHPDALPEMRVVHGAAIARRMPRSDLHPDIRIVRLGPGRSAGDHLACRFDAIHAAERAGDDRFPNG